MLFFSLASPETHFHSTSSVLSLNPQRTSTSNGGVIGRNNCYSLWSKCSSSSGSNDVFVTESSSSVLVLPLGNLFLNKPSSTQHRVAPPTTLSFLGFPPHFPALLSSSSAAGRSISSSPVRDGSGGGGGAAAVIRLLAGKVCGSSSTTTISCK